MRRTTVQEIRPMSAGTAPDRCVNTPSWRVAAVGFALSLTATTALAFGLSAL